MDKELVVGFGGIFLFITMVIGAVVYSEHIDKEYRLEALKETAGCEPCQMVILTKGGH